MLKRVIDGWNAAPGAPAGWEPERDGECGALPVRVHPAPPGQLRPGQRVEWCESAWEPTPRELDAIVCGRSIILRVVGWQVPVALYVDGVVPPDDPGEASGWILRYTNPERTDETFAGENAEAVTRLRFLAMRQVSPCSLFREVARA